MRKRFAHQMGTFCALVLAILRTWRGFLHIAFLNAGMLDRDSRNPRGVRYVTVGRTSSVRETETAVAVRFAGRTDADGFPADESWKNAPAIQFDQDWQGKNADPQRETDARLLWTRDTLYVRFLARHRSLTVFADAEPSGRRDELWERDVAEIFLQPAESVGRCYKEFEVSPNGFWIDLDIAPGVKRDLKSGLKRRASVDENNKTWKAQLILPMKSLTSRFDPVVPWHVNFYRVEGASEPRFYSAWRPTKTPVPNFHVPECFGKLVFET